MKYLVLVIHMLGGAAIALTVLMITPSLSLLHMWAVISGLQCALVVIQVAIVFWRPRHERYR